MRNIRLVVAYDGTDFHGWQRQPNLPTIQECLETTVARLTGETVHVWGSGRTDAGAHALNQVANFKIASPIPCENLVRALNNLLPPAVRVKEACEVAANFHARYDVRSKTYRYRILQARVCSPFLWRFVCHHPFPLDHERMTEAARLFEGEHDFTSFAAVGAEVGDVLQEGREAGDGSGKAPRRDARKHGMVRHIFVSRLLWRARTSLLIYEVTANGFLHHMVRNMVGTLMEVGRGKLAPQDVARTLAARDRSLAGPTAPAQGLWLMRAEY
jgi:tRNA pseudouridine38-40 synthase